MSVNFDFNQNFPRINYGNIQGRIDNFSAFSPTTNIISPYNYYLNNN